MEDLLALSKRIALLGGSAALVELDGLIIARDPSWVAAGVADLAVLEGTPAAEIGAALAVLFASDPLGAEIDRLDAAVEEGARSVGKIPAREAVRLRRVLGLGARGR